MSKNIETLSKKIDELSQKIDILLGVKNQSEKEYLSTEEAAIFLNFTPQNVYRLHREGSLKCIKRNHRLYFKKNDLVAWLEQPVVTLDDSK